MMVQDRSLQLQFVSSRIEASIELGLAPEEDG